MYVPDIEVRAYFGHSTGDVELVELKVREKTDLDFKHCGFFVFEREKERNACISQGKRNNEIFLLLYFTTK